MLKHLLIVFDITNFFYMRSDPHTLGVRPIPLRGRSISLSLSLSLSLYLSLNEISFSKVSNLGVFLIL